MKKILFLAAACAALAACNVSDLEKDTPEVNGDAFVKGQKVVLKVNAGSDTKAAGTFDGKDINFTWSTGDEILVTVEGQGSATFTLKGDGGSASGEFEGEMPGTGTTFSAQYPATEPNLTTQTYDPSHAIASGLMKATATGCTVGSPVELKPEYAVLRLNLYGIERKVSQIVITNMTSTASPKPSYTLSISPSITVSSDKNTPTPFFIVVPAGTSAWNFKTEVTSEPVIPSTYVLPKYPSNTEPNYGSGIIVANVLFTTTSAKTFTAGSILNMQAVSLTTVWAPVNCGYDSDHTYGLLYQWGRTDGGTYDKAWTEPSSHAAETQTQTTVVATWDVNGYNKSPESTKFYKNSSSPYDWYTNNESKQLTEWPMTAPEGTSGIGNPCPKGWRVPTYNELNALLGGNSKPAITAVGGQNGCYFNGTSSASSGVFLPAAGYRYYDSGSARSRGNYGSYWSSAVDGIYARLLYFSSGGANVYDDNRASGYSVRCVQE